MNGLTERELTFIRTELAPEYGLELPADPGDWDADLLAEIHDAAAESESLNLGDNYEPTAKSKLAGGIVDKLFVS